MREWNKKQNERNKTWFRFAVTDRKEHKEKIMDKYYTDLKKKKKTVNKMKWKKQKKNHTKSHTHLPILKLFIALLSLLVHSNVNACGTVVVNDGARAFHIFLSIVVNVVSIIWGVNYKFCNQNVNLTWSQIDANAKNILSHTNKHTHTITLTLNLWTINLIEEGRIIFDFFSVYLS